MKFICRPRISLEGEEYQGGRKRIFIGLMFASCVAICLCILLFFIIPWLGVTNAWLEAASITFGSLIIVLLAWLWESHFSCPYAPQFAWHQFGQANPDPAFFAVNGNNGQVFRH